MPHQNLSLLKCWKLSAATLSWGIALEREKLPEIGNIVQKLPSIYGTTLKELGDTEILLTTAPNFMRRSSSLHSQFLSEFGENAAGARNVYLSNLFGSESA